MIVLVTKRRHVALEYMAVLFIVGTIYVMSCAPGTLWYDSGLFQYRIWHNDIRSGLGLALSHPLYIILGIGIKHISIGEFGYRINLLSAIAGAVTAANVYLFLRLWLSKIFPALVAAITLALSHTMWQQASIAEVYTLYTMFLSLELIFLLQYAKTKQIGYLYWLSFFNGLAISVHMFAIIPLACYTLLFFSLAAGTIGKYVPIKSVLICAVLWMLGALPYEYLVIEDTFKTGDLSNTMISVFFGKSWENNVLNISISSKLISENLILLGLNLPSPNIIFIFLGVAGLYKMAKDRWFAHIILSLLLLFFIFAFRYTVPDRYTFFIPFYCVASIFIGIGVFQFLGRFKKKTFYYLIIISMLVPLPVYFILPKIAEAVGVDLGTKRIIPYRDAYRCYLSPWQGWNNGAEQFAVEALRVVDRDAVIVAANMTVYALNYFQEVKGMRHDVKVLSKHGDYDNPFEFPTKPGMLEQLMSTKKLYVVSPQSEYCPDYLLRNYNFIKVGPLYKVANRN